VHRRRKSIGEWLIQELNAESSVVDGEVVVCVDRERRTVLESTVLDQLGIDATVTGVVDVLRICQ
jgi:hypothetical protein